MGYIFPPCRASSIIQCSEFSRASSLHEALALRWPTTQTSWWPLRKKNQMRLVRRMHMTSSNINSLSVFDNHIEHRYTDVMIEGVLFLIHLLSPQQYCHCWSWKGDMHISAGFNEACCTLEYVCEYSRAPKDNIVENLIDSATRCICFGENWSRTRCLPLCI